MAFGGRGWRKIVVNDALFHWKRDEDDHGFCVRPDDDPNRLLSVGDGRCGSEMRYPLVTPGPVREAILTAARFGWPADRTHLWLAAFADPFRLIGPEPRWRTPAVLALASSIVNDRAFDRLPILADALEEAGCDDADVLAHCRGPGPHFYNCWVLRLIFCRG